METPILLTDDQVKEFLINGYLVLRTQSLDQTFHSKIFSQIQTIFDTEGNPGNNILPRMPELQYVYDDPAIRGALISLLGSNYVMQCHRHPHVTRPGTRSQFWHKDSYFGYRKPLRHHQIRYVMAMYYPQDTTLDMGPTALKPRSQYDVLRPNQFASTESEEEMSEKSDDQNDIYLTCQAGTVLLIHYDIVHKGTANTTHNSNRFMFKFQFNRVEEPTEPTWNHDPKNALYDAADAGLLQPIVKHVWNWMLGRTIPLESNASSQDIMNWKTQINSKDDKQLCLNAAYNLALNNEYQLLIKRLHNNKQAIRLEAAYALTACRHNMEAINELRTILNKEDNNEHIIYSIVFILSEMGSAAIDTLPLLIHLAETNNSWLVKQYCCEALGTIQTNEQHSIDMVVRCLSNLLMERDQPNDPKDVSHVRLTAVLSMAKLGPKAVQAIPVLTDALYRDPNRYVNANALLALERIGTNEALNIVLHYLKMSRWCAKTTANSLW